jgi:hypothetical protein
MQEAVRLGLMSNEDAEARFRAFMEAAREGLGEDAYFLSSWGVLAEVAGMADACRIAMDANPTWAGVRMQLVESARWFHTQRILFLNDPDHVCVRAKLEWVRSVCSLVSLTGGLYMLSDAPDVYQGERLRIIRRTLPPLATVAGETGPLDLTIPAFTWTKLHGFAVPRENAVRAQDASDEEARRMAGLYPTMHDAHPFSSLWAFHLCTPFKTWCVVGRFATAALPASELRVESLGLDPARAYLVFDFWKEQCLGVVSETLACPAREHGQCQILAFSPVLDHPQCIASTRHVSMDAVSIQSQEWRDHALILSLRGVPGTAESYHLVLRVNE